MIAVYHDHVAHAESAELSIEMTKESGGREVKRGREGSGERKGNL
jgi:hypothetical protein